MQIGDMIIPEDIEWKIWSKHHVTPEEVEQILTPHSHFRFVELGDVAGEDVSLMART